jgi:hypothetical protein
MNDCSSILVGSFNCKSYLSVVVAALSVSIVVGVLSLFYISILDGCKSI